MAVNDSAYLRVGGYEMFQGTPSAPTYQDMMYTSQTPGWQVGSQYMTPNYTANFRPAYGGPAGVNNPWQQPPGGFWNSAWYASGTLPIPGLGHGTDMNPWYQPSGATLDYRSHTLATSPADAVMNFGQKWAAPIGAAYLGGKIAGWAPFTARGAKNTIQSWFSGNLVNSESLGARIGAIAGRSAGTVGGGMFGGASRMLIGQGSVMGGAAAGGSAGAFIGATAGSLFGGLAVGYGIMQAANATIFDPYVQTRRGAEAVKSNMVNTYIGGENGNVLGGLGISGRGAYGISSGVLDTAWKDLSLKNNDYISMMDYGMQAGLYNDIGGMSKSQVVDKTKKLAKDVKQIMEVFGEKDIQEAVAILTKFTKMGANVGGGLMGSTMAGLKMASVTSGKSAGELLETIYNPGAYTFQRQGLSGAVGGLVSLDAYKGVSAAVRQGILNKSVLASYGGAEGVSQLITQNMASLSGTDYNKMAMYNTIFGKGPQNGILGNLNAFGMANAQDPLKAMGNLILHGKEMQDVQNKFNRYGVYTQVLDAAKMFRPGQKIDAQTLAGVAKGTFGMGDEEIKAMMFDIQSLKANTAGATKAAQREHTRQYIDSTGFAFMGPMAASVRRGWYGLGDALSSPVRVMTPLLGDASDMISRGIAKWKYYGNEDSRFAGAADLSYEVLSGKKKPAVYNTIKTGNTGSIAVDKTTKMIRDASMDGNNAEAQALANKIISSGRGASASDIDKLNKLTSSGLSYAEVHDASAYVKQNGFQADKVTMKGRTAAGYLDEWAKDYVGKRKGGNQNEVRDSAVSMLTFAGLYGTGKEEDLVGFLEGRGAGERKMYAKLLRDDLNSQGFGADAKAGSKVAKATLDAIDTYERTGALTANNKNIIESMNRVSGKMYARNSVSTRTNQMQKAARDAYKKKGRVGSQDEFAAELSLNSVVTGLKASFFGDTPEAAREANEANYNMVNEEVARGVARGQFAGLDLSSGLAIDGSGGPAADGMTKAATAMLRAADMQLRAAYETNKGSMSTAEKTAMEKIITEQNVMMGYDAPAQEKSWWQRLTD